MMRVTLPYQPSPSLLAASELYSAAASASCRSRSLSKQLIVCAIPARDVVIDFGKFSGSKMGTLPANYLRWLIREASMSSSKLTVWADYAKQVLHDPYYLDRLEWESIEKLAVRGDMRRSVPPAGVKSSMQALGWDLSDRNAWSQVNFSLLGTSLGGRIPRRTPESSVSSPISKPKPTTTNPSLVSGMSTTKASLTGSFTLTSAAALPKNRASKLSVLNAAADKGKPQPSQPLSLQEELLRRRQLRKERSNPKSSSTLSLAREARTLFPGRESLLKKAKDRADK